MEGPTPVSALIYAATMVTAGVYLIARCTPLFVQAHRPTGRRLRRLLHRSFGRINCSNAKRPQAGAGLFHAEPAGYMFLGLGCAVGFGGFAADGLPQGGVEATAAVSASMFHLFTHAFFKMLLFLAAGSVMHAMGNVIDMRRFSGLRKVMPVTHWTFLMGTLALSGLPPFSGFWSKDEVVAISSTRATIPSTAASTSPSLSWP